jgi:hypothetical protein
LGLRFIDAQFRFVSIFPRVSAEFVFVDFVEWCGLEDGRNKPTNFSNCPSDSFTVRPEFPCEFVGAVPQFAHILPDSA